MSVLGHVRERLGRRSAVPGRPGGKREVAALAWPSVLAMLSFTLIGVVTTFMMGKVGTTEQAGVGLGVTLSFIVIAFFREVILGAQPLVAAADGAGDGRRMQQAGASGVYLGVVGAVLGTVAFAVLIPLLNKLVNNAEVAASTGRFLATAFWDIPLTLMAFGFIAGLQGRGDTRGRMLSSVAGNALNVLLAPVMIFGMGPIPAMREGGAGLAMVISTALMASLYAVRYFRLFGFPRWPGGRILRSAVTVGFPAGIQATLGFVSAAAMNLALAHSGAAHLAASEIVLNIVSISFLPGSGVGEASAVLVARYLGAGSPHAAKRAVRSARWLGLAFMGTCGILFATHGEGLVSLFTSDPEVAHLASKLMLFAASFQLFDAVATVNLSALSSAGDTRFTLVVTSIASWCFTVPAAVILGAWLNWGAPGAWLGMTVEMALLAMVTAWRVSGLGTNQVGRLDLILGHA